MCVCVCVCVCTKPFIKYLLKTHKYFFFTTFLPRELLWSSSHVMTDKFHAHVKSCHRMEWLLALQRAPTPVSLLHQRRCFPEKSRPATGNRSRRRGPVPSFHPAPPSCHGHRPKTRAAAATDSKTGRTLPGSPQPQMGQGQSARPPPHLGNPGWAGGFPPLC